MFKYILKRIGISILILLGVSFILYALLRCMPTDFVEAKILALNTSGNTVSEEFKQQMYKTYGLDGNIAEGYLNWIKNICKFDFGQSFISQREVLSEIFNADRVCTSFLVAAVATVFEFFSEFVLLHANNDTIKSAIKIDLKKYFMPQLYHAFFEITKNEISFCQSKIVSGAAFSKRLIIFCKFSTPNFV